MNNKMKYTIPGQVFSIIVTHMQAAFLFFFVWLLAISITSGKTAGFIYSVISSLFYFMMIYSAGYTVVKNDKKSYTELTPIPYKGALLSLGLLLINIIVLAIYHLSWMLGRTPEGISIGWALAGNIFSIFWFSPYMNLLSMENGHIALYGYAIIILLHPIACFLGYFAGYNNFDISTKFKFLVYDQKKDTKKK